MIVIPLKDFGLTVTLMPNLDGVMVIQALALFNVCILMGRVRISKK